MGMCVVSFMPWLLYAQYPMDKRIGGPLSQFPCGGEEKRIPSLPRIETWLSSP